MITGPPSLVAAALSCVLGAGLVSAAAMRDDGRAGPATARAAQAETGGDGRRAERTSRGRAAPAVAPLRRLYAADLLVAVRRPVTPAQAARLRDVRGVTGLTLLDTGTVRVAGASTRVVGVDPSQFRSFTPRETAGADALWAAVARGEVAPTYAVARSRGLRLGAPVAVVGHRTVTERVGAHAVYGLPGVDLVTDRRSARSYGVVRDSGVLLSAPSRSVTALRREVRRVLGADARVEVLRPVAVRAATRPRTYRELYMASARYCPGLRWQVLAAIGQVESGHGRNNGPSSAGALGPMQFLPATWAAYGVDGDGDRRADVMNAHDAVPAAALYLCRYGAGRGGQDLYDAIWMYNHADWYVRQVLDLAARYR